MRSVKPVFAAIDRFFFAPYTDGRFLILLRVGLCLVLGVQVLCLQDDMSKLFGQAGLVVGELSNVEIPGHMLTLDRLHILLADWMPLTPDQLLRFVLGLYIFSLVTLSVGLFTRASAVIAWLTHLIIIKNGPFLTYGVDYILTLLLFYCVVMPVGRSGSVDRRLFRRANRPVNYQPWRRILQLHMMIVYTVSGFAKIIGPNWWNGESIWKALNRPIISDFNFFFLAEYPWILAVAGISVFTLELLYPVFINVKSMRKIWLLGTCLMHLGIAILLDLPFFAATMILFNLTAFYSYVFSPAPSSQAVTGSISDVERTMGLVPNPEPLR